MAARFMFKYRRARIESHFSRHQSHLSLKASLCLPGRFLGTASRTTNEDDALSRTLLSRCVYIPLP